MHLVVVHHPADSALSVDSSLLRLAFSCRPLTDIVLDGISRNCGLHKNDFDVAIPCEWEKEDSLDNSNIRFYESKVTLPKLTQSHRYKTWFVISNGRFLVWTDMRLLYKTVEQLGTDVVTVNIRPGLRAGHEKVLADSDGNLVGFRLLYADTVQPEPVSSDWPHYVFVNSNLVGGLFTDGNLSRSFDDFIEKCNSISASIKSISVGGDILDLNTEKGLLLLLSFGLTQNDSRIHGGNGHIISDSARLFGEIVLGRKVEIGEKAIVAGPAVIGEGTRIGEEAVIHSSIIGPHVSVPQGSIVRNRVITDSRQFSRIPCQTANNMPDEIGNLNLADIGAGQSCFRTWPRLSYARFTKRIADLIVALVVLVIFAPVLPIIALAVKLSSRGQVFFKDPRQGLHGKPFICPKFRTMLVGADKLQEKLRVINEADGPQFVIADDPRMSKVGRFLRETYLDEIPQFFAVLLGRMSVVGPRPSPESENVLCPFWRDARLSVKPGITGLWQVCRTRRPMKDFQEWIHYDIEYVRNLSMGLDLWICWKTAVKMVKNFISQF